MDFFFENGQIRLTLPYFGPLSCPPPLSKYDPNRSQQNKNS